MSRNTKSGGPTRKNSVSSRLKKNLAGWVEVATAEDAAVMINVMRENPDMAKSEMGMLLYPEAIKKIRGTHWESALFPKPIPATIEAELILFRQKCDDMWPDDDGAA